MDVEPNTKLMGKNKVKKTTETGQLQHDHYHQIHQQNQVPNIDVP